MISEIDKLKQMIALCSTEVGRLKRETKKYEEMLPLEEENQEELYLRFKRLKRELDDKR